MTELSFAGPKGFRLDPLWDEGAHMRQVKQALARLGYYIPPDGAGMTPHRDANFEDALYAFQRHATIFFGDTDIELGSTTERVLRQELEGLDDNALYVWRTAGDGKVRDGHARKEGMVFRWNDLQGGDHPGEDYNCRCRAEPMNPPRNAWSEWARERQERRNLYPDAIEPAIGPVEILTGGIAARSAISAIVRARIKENNAYKIASRGGKHHGYINRYRNVSKLELERAIKSYDKQIKAHEEKIRNPQKEIPNFYKFDLRKQRNLLEEKWPKDIRRLKEQREVLKGIKNDRD